MFCEYARGTCPVNCEAALPPKQSSRLFQLTSGLFVALASLGAPRNDALVRMSERPSFSVRLKLAPLE